MDHLLIFTQRLLLYLSSEKTVPLPQNPYRQEVDDMLHDLPIMEHMGQLVAQLRMKYEVSSAAQSKSEWHVEIVLYKILAI